MNYTVSSDYLKGEYANLSLTNARKKAYQMLSEHPRTKAVVYIDGKNSREYVSWTMMHCGKRFITRFTHIDNHRILKKDGTLGIHIKVQWVREGKDIIGHRFYAGKEPPKSGVVIDLYDKVIRRK